MIPREYFMRICYCHCIVLTRSAVHIHLARSRASLDVFGFKLGSLQVLLPSQEAIPGVFGNEILVSKSCHSMLLGKASRSFTYEGIWRDSTEAQGFVAGIQDELGQ
jgi:hypothetical protein